MAAATPAIESQPDAMAFVRDVWDYHFLIPVRRAA
jgi:hypothetical protein